MIHVHIRPKKRPATLASVAQPRQARSRTVMNNIVNATLALLRRQRFEDISVADIARRSGVAVGTVYTRFPGKDQLLLHLFDTIVLADVRAIIGVEQARRAGQSLDEFLFRFFWAVRSVFVRHGAILRPLALVARGANDSLPAQFVGALNATIHERLRDAIKQHSHRIRHPRPDVAIQMAILWAGAALREKCLYNLSNPAFTQLTDRQFVQELVHGVLAYLGSAGDNGGRA